MNLLTALALMAPGLLALFFAAILTDALRDLRRENRDLRRSLGVTNDRLVETRAWVKLDDRRAAARERDQERFDRFGLPRGGQA